MPLSDLFDQWSTSEQRQFTAAVYNYFTGAEERHKQILGRFDLLIAAAGAGLRAAGETLERGARRR